MILVTGATGTVGKEVVKLLVEQKVPLRIMTRDPAKAKAPAGVPVVQGDHGDPASLAKAMQGATKLFALSSGPQIPVHDKNLAQAAKAAGLTHIVKLSASSAADHPEQLIGRWHVGGEQAIKDSGLAWTMVRPGGFMSNAYAWAATVKGMGKVFSATGNGKAAPIDPRDIAAVAVKALTENGHSGKAYLLSGPEALTMEEQVALLSKAIGKPVTCVPVDEAAARDGMSKSGMPAIVVDAVLELMAVIRSGKGAHVSPVVGEVLGRPARTYAAWFAEHKAAFV